MPANILLAKLLIVIMLLDNEVQIFTVSIKFYKFILCLLEDFFDVELWEGF